MLWLVIAKGELETPAISVRSLVARERNINILFEGGCMRISATIEPGRLQHA